MSYARRRATIACRYCRHRKRRCDGIKPSCSLCSSAGVDCKYPDKDANNIVMPSATEPDQPETVSMLANSNRESLVNRQNSRESDSSNEALVRRINELEAIIKSQHNHRQGRRASQANYQHEFSEEYEEHNEESQVISDTLPEELDVQPMDYVHEGPSPSTVATPSASTLQQDGLMSNFNITSHLPFPDTMVTSFSPQTSAYLLPVVYPRQYREDYAYLHPTVEDTASMDEEAFITIPAGHHTTTSSLFTLPTIRSLIGDYSASLFSEIESAKEWKPPLYLGQDFPEVLDTLDLTQDTTERLLDNYFSYVHPKYPILDAESFPDFFKQSLQDCTSQSDLAVCLLVLALGDLGSTEDPVDTYSDSNGVAYFGLAYRILTTGWVGSFGTHLSTPTGLVLAAVFCSFKAQPLPAWRLAYIASNMLQLLATRPKTDFGHTNDYDMLSRLCWTCFVVECDSLSEFHLPRSGIELAIDRMYFPRFGNRSDQDGMMFLALCSIRRLLNRIHNAVYTTSKKATAGPANSSEPSGSSQAAQHSSISVIASLEGVLDELARQLHAWYHSLPAIIKPDLSTNTPQGMQDAWLRLRYWSARHIIYRPCLICATTWSSGQEVPAFVLEYSKKCIQSSVNYVETAIFTLDKLTHFSWMTVQACLSNCLLLATAVNCPLLRDKVPGIGDLLSNVVTSLEPWATPDSSAEVAIWILRTLKHKVHLLTTRSKA